MSTSSIEQAVEAIEKKVEDLTVADNFAAETGARNQNDEPALDNTQTDKSELKSEREKKPRMSDEERRALWEEEQAKKPIIETGLKGTVKWYSVLGHYGFIERADGKPDVFVHQSSISKSHTIKFYLRTLAKGEEVEFDVVEGTKGLEAANVSGPEGAEVRGSRNRMLLARFRRAPKIAGGDGDMAAGDNKAVDQEAAKKRKRRVRRRNPKEGEMNESGDKVERRRQPRRARTMSAKQTPEKEELTGGRRRAASGGSEEHGTVLASPDRVALGAGSPDAMIVAAN